MAALMAADRSNCCDAERVSQQGAGMYCGECGLPQGPCQPTPRKRTDSLVEGLCVACGEPRADHLGPPSPPLVPGHMGYSGDPFPGACLVKDGKKGTREVLHQKRSRTAEGDGVSANQSTRNLQRHVDRAAERAAIRRGEVTPAMLERAKAAMHAEARGVPDFAIRTALRAALRPLAPGEDG